MNERIRELAEEADAFADAMDVGGKNYIGLRDEYFAELVAAAEREACARVCDALASPVHWMTAQTCAEAIRARGKA